MAIEEVFSERKRPSMFLWGALILVLAVFLYWGLPAIKKAFFTTPFPPVEKTVEKEKLWHETLPEPAKKQAFTVSVVPPPKVVGTIQPKGGK